MVDPAPFEEGPAAGSGEEWAHKFLAWKQEEAIRWAGHEFDEDGIHDEDACEVCLLANAPACSCRCGQCCHLIIEVMGLLLAGGPRSLQLRNYIPVEWRDDCVRGQPDVKHRSHAELPLADQRCRAQKADTPRADFWNTQKQVIASVHTLRLDHGNRHERLLEAEPWDMVVVDEAHHLNADEESGPTLGYKLVEKLVAANRIGSMVFFTGTPHRGKNFGFLALLRLLRPDQFDPRKPIEAQLPQLRGVMIRNNKHEVTDLAGVRLFHEPLVKSETYCYAPEEDRFYGMLTEFIITGKAYARTLAQTEGRAVMLVLIAMQKLASSSVAAIRRALKGRLNRIVGGRRRLAELEERLRDYRAREEEEDVDAASALEEQIAELSAQLVLMEDEEPRLRELVVAADAVTNETKVQKILELVDGPFSGRAVLFFTEYKATQSLLMSRLLQRFGPGCVTFINGDETADEVSDGSGAPRILRETRLQAADRFNAGSVRFLVSTEAGGEGIDLQENCHSLIHVDLPWNPMRLHQRVGRLNRYGQKQRVEVFTLRNPDTIESRIWEKLNLKIGQIARALGQVMAQPEDLLQLVLGMSSPSMFREIFADANAVRPDALSDWFDAKTARFGGQDVLDTVRALVGNAARFDFRQASGQLPQLDLSDLRPFFNAMLHLNKRQVKDEADGISFLTPEQWLSSPAVARQYSGMIFDRTGRDLQKILGVGHRLVDQAISQARELTVSAAALPAAIVPFPIYVFRITDRVTSQRGAVRATAVAVEHRSDGFVLLRDWEIIRRLNQVLEQRDPRRYRVQGSVDPGTVQLNVDAAGTWLNSRFGQLELPFRIPDISICCVLLPGDRLAPPSEQIGEGDDGS
jgi:superfamily II DNA or RNA helicase